jgi:hypothetical protein
VGNDPQRCSIKRTFRRDQTRDHSAARPRFHYLLARHIGRNAHDVIQCVRRERIGNRQFVKAPIYPFQAPARRHEVAFCQQANNPAMIVQHR